MPTARGSWRRDWRRVGKAEADVEVDADMVEEKLEEEEEEAEEDEENSLIKSNNPHLAGGKLGKNTNSIGSPAAPFPHWCPPHSSLRLCSAGTARQGHAETIKDSIVSACP